jgi:hypothetical protein
VLFQKIADNYFFNISIIFFCTFKLFPKYANLHLKENGKFSLNYILLLITFRYLLCWCRIYLNFLCDVRECMLLLPLNGMISRNMRILVLIALYRNPLVSHHYRLQLSSQHYIYLHLKEKCKHRETKICMYNFPVYNEKCFEKCLV